MVFTLGSAYVSWQAVTGASTNAQVLQVERVRGGVHYLVQFTTADGISCESRFWANLHKELAVGAQVRVRYPRHGDSCTNVRKDGDLGWIAFPLISLVLLTVGVVGANIAWRRTDPDGRIRW